MTVEHYDENGVDTDLFWSLLIFIH